MDEWKPTARTKGAGTAMMFVGLLMIISAMVIMVTGPDPLPIPLAGAGLVFVAVGARTRRQSTG